MATVGGHGEKERGRLVSPEIIDPPRRTATPRIITAGTCVVMAMLMLLSGRAALAAPSPSQVETQISQAWNSLEPLIEQYNQVHSQLQANQAKAAALQKQMQPLQLQVAMAMTRVGSMSARLYMTGPGYQMAGLLTSGTPATMVDRLSTMNQMARAQTESVSAVAAQRDKVAAAKQPYDLLVAKLSTQDAQLAAKKNTIQARLASLQKLRQQAYGSTGTGTGVLKPVSTCPVEYYGDKGSRAAATACSLIGKPYIWAAAGPRGYDCSGLTLAAWASVGVTLQHFTGWQWNEGKPVSRANIRPGDLVFFFSDLHHMGIYVGGGWFVHAPTTGDFVRMARLDSGYLPVAGFRRPG